MITHITMWKFKEPHRENAAKAKAALDTCSGLIPGMLRYDTRLDMGIDSSPWDLVLISEFTDRAAMDEYQKHPAHDAVKAVIGPIRAERAALDYES